MSKIKKQLTQEQIDYRNNILRGKVKQIKKTEERVEIVTDEDKIRQCFFYLNNCVFWINEYIDGNESKERLLLTAQAIQGNAKKLEQLLFKIKTK
jgi:hypothetical protein